MSNLTGRELLSEIIQAFVAMTLLAPTVFIFVYQTVNSHPVGVPDLLAGLDGTVVAFYFRGVVSRVNGAAVTAAVSAAAIGAKA